MANDQKNIVVGRLWAQDNDVYTGYLDIGLFGRLQITVEPNDTPGKSTFKIMMRIGDTPFGGIKHVSKRINRALYEDEIDKTVTPKGDEVEPQEHQTD